MKNHLCKAIILLLVSYAQAQPANKMNMALHRLERQDAPGAVSILVQGDPDKLATFLSMNGGTLQCAAGDIASVKIPRNKIAALASQEFILRMEATVNQFETLNDTMRVRSHIDEVHQGMPPLAQPYDGEGVIMGLVDAGIDLSHPDFMDSLGHTRVKWLWDMTKPDSANTPAPYGYGQEWNDAEIDAGTCTHTGQDQFGHGSYVAGIATGNGRAVGHFQGAAPACDIIAVAFDFAATDTTPRLAHAIDYIFNKASQMGKPCVINVSIGDYYGSHDGLDLQSQFISNLINQQCGRIVVAGCGDIGTNYAYHLGNSPAAGDTTFTWFAFNPSYGGCYVQIFADAAQFTNVRFGVGADQVTPYYDFRGRTALHSPASWGGGVHTETLMNGTNRIGVVQSLLTQMGGVYSLEYFVIPDSTTYNWRFITTGTGHYDSWSFDWVWQNLPTSATYPDMVHYRTTDTVSTIVSGMQCLDNVIAVGQYCNTDRHVDVNGVLQITPTDTAEAMVPNSGRGPTRDGRLKPDICAPGNHIISCGVLAFLPGMIASQPYKVAQGGFHITGGGTSASSPVVAGIAALYLQQNPGACWQDFKTALLGCASTDNFTWGPLPNNTWGYGKANAFNTLTTCGPVGLAEVSGSDFSGVVVYPNPSMDFIRIKISAELLNKHCTVNCFDAMGREIFSKEINTAVSEINIAGLNNGVYEFRISSEKNVMTKRVIKL